MQQIDQGQLLASIAATSHDCILSVDIEGRILWASPATLDVLGWRPEDLAGSELAVVAPREGGDLHAAYLHQLLEGERVAPFLDAGVRRDGSTFKASITLGPVHDADGEVTGVTVILRDVTAELSEHRELAQAQEASHAHVEQTPTTAHDPDSRSPVANLRDLTEQVQTEEALRLSEALHRAMVETAQEGILAMAPDGTTTFANETAAQLLGRPLDELYGGDTLALLGLPGWESGAGRFEVAYRHPDGRERILEGSVAPLSSPEPEALGSLVMVSDVTEARRVELTLRRQALHDSLTGLPNRYLFLDRLETAAARQQRSEGRGTAVLYLDLDRFKPVNDGHGHDVGDGLLQEVAGRLAGAVRATDTVGRLGGDEFAIICEDTDEQAAVLVAAKILGELRKPFRRHDDEHQISVSIGVAVCPPHDFEDLVRRADGAMYRAKQLGGGRITVARPEDVTDPSR